MLQPNIYFTYKHEISTKRIKFAYAEYFLNLFSLFF